VFGIFYVLFTGILVAVLLAVGEFCFESRRNSVRLALTLPGRLINYIYSRNQIDDETNGERPEQCQQQNKVRIQTDSEKIGCKFEDGAVNSRLLFYIFDVSGRL
jgi:hypothetical protein